MFGLPLPQQALAVRRRCGVVPQLDSLDPDFTVSENLEVYARYFGITPRRFGERKQQLLEFAALTERAAQRIQTLSGGMRRRLSIARALVNDPELVILDEPTTGLDPQARHLIWARLGELKGRGKTMLLTTHYMEEAERLCDQLLIMDHGCIVARGSPEALIAAHAEPQVFEIRNAAGATGTAVRTALAPLGGAVRTEEAGDTLYCYGAAQQPLAARLDTVAGLRYLQRPATLEDVFLRLTGRKLRE